MYSLMNIAAIPSVQRLTAVKLLAYNIRGNPCSRDMVYREIRLDILNVKCDPIMIGSLITENGFYPAYHMNKSNWITVALDGSADDEKIKFLLDMSFDLTSKKTKNERK